MDALLRKPSAWLPIVFSTGIMAMIVFTFTRGNLTPQSDEGTVAHIFQLWLVTEAVLIGFFAAKWLPAREKAARFILAVQIIAVLIACAPILLLHL
jgi:hypothetical protein